MHNRLRLILHLLFFFAAIATPANARDPADPGTRVPPTRYDPLTTGTRSYRPVEPMPWSDVNRRVAPPAKEGQSQPAQPQPKSKPEKDKQ